MGDISISLDLCRGAPTARSAQSLGPRHHSLPAHRANDGCSGLATRCRAARPRPSAWLSRFCITPAVVGLCLYLFGPSMAVRLCQRERLWSQSQHFLLGGKAGAPGRTGTAMVKKHRIVEDNLCTLAWSRTALFPELVCSELGDRPQDILFG